MATKATDKKQEIWEALRGVEDPEIPVLSVVDLGIVTEVEIAETGHVTVHMTPTFTGCPAIDVMKKGIENKLETLGLNSYEVQVNYKTSWDSNRISEEGKEKLEKFGLGKPEKHDGEVDMEKVAHSTCPYCGSDETELQSVFGSTLCRSIHYCHKCQQTFERFKPV